MTRFAEKASLYDSHATVQQELATWLSHSLPPHPDPISTALELGAGTGGFTRHLAPLFPRLVPTDIESSMIARGKQMLPKLPWRMMNAWNISDQSWNWIASASLLQWAPDPFRIARHLTDSLAPNGHMLHGFYVNPTLPECTKLFSAFSAVEWRSPDTWIDAFKQAGMYIIRTETHTHIATYPHALNLLRSIHNTGAVRTAGSVPPHNLRQFLKTYETHYSTNNSVHATWTFFKIEMIKPAS